MGNENPKHKAKRGLELPITGAPTSDEVITAGAPARVALVADDYVGMRPSFKVKEGESVKRGQVLFEDRKNPGVLYTSPGCGTVAALNRGARRALQSVVVELSDADADDSTNEVSYEAYTGQAPAEVGADEVRALLIESGMWTAFRTRPFSKAPAVDSSPDALFVTAMDSNPLAPKPEVVIARNKEAYEAGLAVIATLAGDAPVFYCKAAGEKMPVENVGKASVQEFSGKHPAGTVGFHIHSVFPVNAQRVAWHLGYQDVLAIGSLFITGKLNLERVISVAGPAAKEPGLVATRVGAAVDGLVDGKTRGDDVCVISGSVFSGREASGEIHGFMGRYVNQISLLENDRSRRLLGWMSPGTGIFSVTRTFLSGLMPGKKFDLTTDQYGGHRTLVPFASYDKVMAFDLMAVFLLRSLLSGDIETAEQMGALELDEEDVSLFTFVCPSKNEYGPALRDVLTRIEKEG